MFKLSLSKAALVAFGLLSQELIVPVSADHKDEDENGKGYAYGKYKYL